MSTDWNKYATPEEVQQRRAEPQLNGVIQMNVGSIRKISPLSVKHAPLAENRAHTNVHGLSNEPGKKQKIRTELARISNWRITLSS